MRVFGTYKQLRRANNRILGRFFAVMFVGTLLFAFIVGFHYLLGWW